MDEFVGCLTGLLKFCVGTIAGAVATFYLLPLIDPPDPSIPDCGMGYGMGALFVAMIVGLLTGIAATFIKLEQ